MLKTAWRPFSDIPAKRQILGTFALLALSLVLERLTSLWAFGILGEQLAESRQALFLAVMVSAVLFRLAGDLCNWAASRVENRAVASALASTRVRCLRRLLDRRSPYARSAPDAGDTITRVQQDSEKRLAFLQTCLRFATLFPALLVLICVAVAREWRLCAIAFFLNATLQYALVNHVERRLERASENVQKAAARATEAALRIVRAVPVNRWALPRADAEAFFAKANAALRETSWRKARVRLCSDTLNALFSALSEILYVAVGGWLCATRGVRIGSFLAIWSIREVFTQPIALVLEVRASWYETRPSLRRLDELCSVPAACAPSAAAPAGDAAVSMRNVRFSYDGARDVLRDFSLEIPAGAVFALRGESGAGKSTVFSLICGLIEPDVGEIALMGRAPGQPGWDAAQSRVLCARQEAHIFSGSAVENVRLWDTRVSEERVRAVLEELALDAVLTRLSPADDAGGRAQTLSRGERQRLALARLLVRDGQVVLLDEPVSALDPQTASLVERAFIRYVPGRTLVFISHSPFLTAQTTGTRVLPYLPA